MEKNDEKISDGVTISAFTPWSNGTRGVNITIIDFGKL